MKAVNSKYLSLIESSLSSLFTDSSPYKIHYSDPRIREMAHYNIASGGKRIRPLCVFLAAQSYLEFNSQSISDEVIQDKILPFALAVELIHNATLIHDDFQDGDEVRRGAPTLWKKYSAEQAINIGDLLFFIAQELIVDAPMDAELALFLTRQISEKTKTVIEGQCLELLYRDELKDRKNIPSLADYQKMVQGKTAALFAMPIIGGAKIAGASDSEIENLSQACADLGMAFQIQDDYIDIWGEKGRGKRARDIAEGKLSFPILNCLEQLGNESDRERVKQTLCRSREHTSEADISWCVAKMEECGVKELCLNEFHRLLENAKKNSVLQSAFLEIATELESRI